jgi:ribosome-associated translation inhibitor RaiA
MKIIIQNNTQLAQKYIRFIKWKIYGAKNKFEQLLYVDIHLNTEGQNPKTYTANIRLGIPGNDIIIRKRDINPGTLFTASSNAIHRHLGRYKNKLKETTL